MATSMYATAASCQHSSSVTETFHVDPEQSGKLLVLYRMMLTLRALKVICPIRVYLMITHLMITHPLITHPYKILTLRALKVIYPIILHLSL